MKTNEQLDLQLRTNPPTLNAVIASLRNPGQDSCSTTTNLVTSLVFMQRKEESCARQNMMPRKWSRYEKGLPQRVTLLPGQGGERKRFIGGRCVGGTNNDKPNSSPSHCLALQHVESDTMVFHGACGTCWSSISPVNFGSPLPLQPCNTTVSTMDPRFQLRAATLGL